MSESKALLDCLDAAIWELGEAFKDLPDGDAWKRAHPNLLSVGENAAHIAYWEATTFLGEGVQSPLVTKAASYYTTNVGNGYSLPLTSQEIYDEVVRIHGLCKDSFLAADPELDVENENRGWTWRQALQYQGFHIAYHTGQIYSVRHLLGHQTVDN